MLIWLSALGVLRVRRDCNFGRYATPQRIFVLDEPNDSVTLATLLKPHPYHGVVEGNGVVIRFFRPKPTKSDRDFEELQDKFKKAIKTMEAADGKYRMRDLRKLVLGTRLTLAKRQTLSVAAQIGLKVGAGAEDLDEYKRLLVEISEVNRKVQNDHDNNSHLNDNKNGSADEDDLHEQDLEHEEQLTHQSYAELRTMFDDPEVREIWGDELYTAVWRAKLEEMDEDHLSNLDRDQGPRGISHHVGPDH